MNLCLQDNIPMNINWNSFFRFYNPFKWSKSNFRFISIKKRKLKLKKIFWVDFYICGWYLRERERIVECIEEYIQIFFSSNIISLYGWANSSFSLCSFIKKFLFHNLKFIFHYLNLHFQVLYLNYHSNDWILPSSQKCNSKREWNGLKTDKFKSLKNRFSKTVEKTFFSPLHVKSS